MARVTGSYESVVRGVSEQVPHDRRSGQCYEQVNMISDPVHGNARRHGSVLLHETPITGSYDTLVADTASTRVTPLFVDGVKYDLILRKTAAGSGRTSLVWCFNQGTNQFIPVVYSTADATLDLLASGGVSAAVNVGRYAYLAGNSIVPSFTGTDTFGATANQSKAAVWVRGGAYSRTFKINITKLDGTKLEASYKTVSSSYPGLLDTSDLLTSDPDYQKKVNDRVYAYNSAVTQWIGTSSNDITPENIATKLAAALVTLGITNVLVNAGTVTIDDPTLKEVTGSDGGDGTLLRPVGNELTAAELVSTIHYVGKIVKIRPQRSKGDDAFYLKAYAKNDGETGFAPVSWREAAGYEMQPDAVFAIGTVVAGTFYLAGSPAKLQAISGITTPNYVVNGVGDQLTSVLPYFFGQTITYLGLFQDRLMIGAGATVFATRPGDYFNFFRQSIITVIDTDPVEEFALGAEADTLRHSTTYDRDLILFGDRFQYTISGRQVLSPKTSGIVIVSSYKDANDAAPVTLGNFIFYGKYSGDPGELRTSLHQVQAGQIAESPESFEVSQQLDSYIQGRPIEVLSLDAPKMVVLRTDAVRSGLYIYSFLDTPNGSQRLNDSWGRWSWATKLGSIIGVSNSGSDILVYMLRQNAGITYVAAERFSRITSLSRQPYLDSLRPVASALSAPFLSGVSAGVSVAIGYGSALRFIGQPYTAVTDFMASHTADAAYTWAGFDYPAYWTPTNPYMQDRNGKSILTGRLTLVRVLVTFADTGGFTVDVTSSVGTTRSLTFNGRLLGAPADTIGQQPVVATTLGATIGREIRECQYAISALNWLPLTITALGWSGQSFNNARRVS